MKYFFIPLAFVAAIGLAACGNLDVRPPSFGFGSILGPQVGAEQTDYDQDRIGSQFKRLAVQTRRFDQLNSTTEITATNLALLVTLRSNAKDALTSWNISPRSEAKAAQAIASITAFEKKLDEMGAPAVQLSDLSFDGVDAVSVMLAGGYGGGKGGGGHGGVGADCQDEGYRATHVECE